MAGSRGIRRLLIANRGEIARRVMRTAREMGITTIAVYSDPDRRSPHVRDADVAVPLGGSSAAESYLDASKLLDAAGRAGADAVHPGYGFLSENAAFAHECQDAGLTWVGPAPETIRLMAGKVEAKVAAARAGVPVLPSAVVAGDDPDAWSRSAVDVGFPLLVKASAGGGGKGMRRVDEASQLAEAVVAGRREAASSFGDPTVFLERLLERPRHVEVQVIGDEHGTVLHLVERDCSLQRRHQKVIEEAPAPGLLPAVRDGLLDAAVALARSIGYVNAGTVEFLVSGDELFFLEMNTRLQVEHPVTEAILGIDLVRLQLQVARGEPLSIVQADVVPRGHAVEARLYAEDPAADFLPSTGRLHRFVPPESPAVRWDTGVESGSEISSFYDPMLAKVIAHGADRSEAAARLASALRGLAAHGVRTNRGLLADTLDHPAFRQGAVHTAFFDDHPEVLDSRPPSATAIGHAICAALVLDHRRRFSPVARIAPTGWRNVRRPQRGDRYVVAGGDPIEVLVRAQLDTEVVVDGQPIACSIVEVDERGADVEIDGVRHRCTVDVGADRCWVDGSGWQTEIARVPRFVDGATDAAGGGPSAPLPGTIVAVEVSEGQPVQEGDVLVVLEAMKMEHRIVAAMDAEVEEVLVKVGDQVDAHQLLVRLRSS